MRPDPDRPVGPVKPGPVEHSGSDEVLKTGKYKPGKTQKKTLLDRDPASRLNRASDGFGKKHKMITFGLQGRAQYVLMSQSIYLSFELKLLTIK